MNIITNLTILIILPTLSMSVFQERGLTELCKAEIKMKTMLLSILH